MPNQINQKGASARGDIVAGDKQEIHYHESSSKPSGIVELLLKTLRTEIEQNAHVRHTIDNLLYFQTARTHDGIVGLQAKLHAADRDDECMGALEKKELFAKLLEKWSLYASAQEIFAFLLAKAEHEFNYFVYPQIAKLDRIAINQLVNDRIVEPTMQECGSSIFTLNHSTVMGMIYWLAEQCFVRWHQ